MRNSKRVVDKFPYTAGDLAEYMNYVCDQIKPVEEMVDPPVQENEDDRQYRGRMTFAEAMAAGIPIAPP